MIKAVIFDFSGVLAFDDGANKELIDYMKSQLSSNYKLAIISNATGYFIDEYLGGDVSLFDEIVLSGQHNFQKPDKEIFEYTAKALDVKPSESIFIDDNQTHVLGAQTAGMQAIYYKNISQMKSELEKLLAAVTNN